MYRSTLDVSGAGFYQYLLQGTSGGLSANRGTPVGAVWWQRGSIRRDENGVRDKNHFKLRALSTAWEMSLRSRQLPDEGTSALLPLPAHKSPEFSSATVRRVP